MFHRSSSLMGYRSSTRGNRLTRKVMGVLLAVVCLSPIALHVSSAGATAFGHCAITAGSITFSPPLPMFGDATTVVPAITGTETFSGCVGLGGITSGTSTFMSVAQGPQNCNTDFPNDYGPDVAGTTTITWNNGKTTTLEGHYFSYPNTDAASGGLFVGGSFSAGALNDRNSGTGGQGLCATGAVATDVFNYFNGGLFITLPDVTGPTTCPTSHACTTSRQVAATANSPGLAVTVAGTPQVGNATVSLSIASGKLTCPKVATIVRPIADARDTFRPSDRLQVTATFQSASSTAAEQVCFKSTVPFFSQTSPKVAKSGTGLLLACTKVANVAPCVTSSKPVGDNLVVQFVMPGGDPQFTLVEPTGKEMWLQHRGVGHVGKPFSASIGYRGGRAPVSWSIASGKLPAGCAINAQTGLVSGKPTATGTFKSVVQALDSEKPAKKATIPLSVTIS